MISQKDKEVIRRLAGRVREIAELPVMEERRRSICSFNALKPEKPLILCFPEGAWRELLPESAMVCEEPRLRAWEWTLRSQIYWWEHINDDNALEPWFNIPWDITVGDYGVEIKEVHGEGFGSFRYDPPITDLEKDFEKLHFREFKVNRELVQENFGLAEELFGDLLPSRIRGYTYNTCSITWEALKLIGMEALFTNMYDDPDNLHRLIRFLGEDQKRYYEWLEQERLLTLNNENDYIGTGGVGYTDQLPQKDSEAKSPIRLTDTWGRTDSQETIGVSPTMFAEFVLQYQLPILEKFGLNCYGCCEPIQDRWQFIKDIPNLRRLSVSPWSDQEKMADYLGKKYIFSRKPNPSPVCTDFDEDIIRNDIRNTLKIAKDNVLEIIMKDTHTIRNQPDRITRWVEIARKEVDSI